MIFKNQSTSKKLLSFITAVSQSFYCIYEVFSWRIQSSNNGATLVIGPFRVDIIGKKKASC